MLMESINIFMPFKGIKNSRKISENIEITNY